MEAVFVLNLGLDLKVHPPVMGEEKEVQVEMIDVEEGMEIDGVLEAVLAGDAHVLVLDLVLGPHSLEVDMHLVVVIVHHSVAVVVVDLDRHSDVLGLVLGVEVAPVLQSELGIVEAEVEAEVGMQVSWIVVTLLDLSHLVVGLLQSIVEAERGLEAVHFAAIFPLAGGHLLLEVVPL